MNPLRAFTIIALAAAALYTLWVVFWPTPIPETINAPPQTIYIAPSETVADTPPRVHPEFPPGGKG